MPGCRTPLFDHDSAPSRDTMAVRQIFSGGPGRSPVRRPENPSAAIPFPASAACRNTVGTDERRASIIVLHYTKAACPCQGSRQTESARFFRGNLAHIAKQPLPCGGRGCGFLSPDRSARPDRPAPRGCPAGGRPGGPGQRRGTGPCPRPPGRQTPEWPRRRSC